MAAGKPNVTIEKSIFIARPPADIWHFLSDINNDQLWRQGMVGTQWTSGEPGSLGSTAVYTIEGAGEITWQLTEFEEPRVIGWDYISGRLDGGHGCYRMEPESGGTRMAMRMELTTSLIFGTIMKLIVPRQMAGELRTLKALMEDRPNINARAK